MIRHARIPDVKPIHQLLRVYADEGQLLGRSLADIYDALRDFYVFEEQGEIVGVCALAICWEDLAEVRSLAVKEEMFGRGVGRELVLACLEEARQLGLRRVFALTYQPEFFQKLGFAEIEKSELPHKIWAACLNCVKFPDCDELAFAIELQPAVTARP